MSAVEDPGTIGYYLQQIAGNTTPVPQALPQNHARPVAAPTQGWPYYIDSSNSVQFVLYTSIAALAQQAVIKTMDLSGNIHGYLVNLAQNPGLRIGQRTVWNAQGEGWLIGVEMAGSAGGDVKRGQVYIQCYLGSSPIGTDPATGNPVGTAITLFNDYVSTGYNTSWPPGRVTAPIEGPGYIYNVAPSNPAVGTNYSVEAPTGARWRIRGMFFSLVTSSVAGNRQTLVEFQDSAGNIFQESKSFPIEVPSSTKFFSLQPGYTLVDAAFDALSGAANQPLQEDLTLSAGMKIVTATAAFDPGDQYQGMSLIVEEWLEP